MWPWSWPRWLQEAQIGDLRNINRLEEKVDDIRADMREVKQLLEAIYKILKKLE